jgi:TctA family transporter
VAVSLVGGFIGFKEVHEMGEEPFEALLMALFAIPSLYIFLKNDVKKLLKKA